MLHYMIAVQAAHALLTGPFRLHTPCPGPLLVLAIEQNASAAATLHLLLLQQSALATTSSTRKQLHATTRAYGCVAVRCCNVVVERSAQG